VKTVTIRVVCFKHIIFTMGGEDGDWKMKVSTGDAEGGWGIISIQNAY
jgi:hypothetical protein